MEGYDINFDHRELEDDIQDDDATEDDNKNIFLPNIKIFFLNICFKNINIITLATCIFVWHSLIQFEMFLETILYPIASTNQKKKFGCAFVF